MTKIKLQDYSLISNEWIDSKIEGLKQRTNDLNQGKTDDIVDLVRLSNVQLNSLEYIKRNQLIPSETLYTDPAKDTADYIDANIVQAMVEVAKQTLYTEEQVREAYWIGVNRGNGHLKALTDDEYIQSFKQQKQ